MTVLAAVIAIAVVSLVVLVAILGWGGAVSQPQRIGLCAMAAGLLWAGPARALGMGVGLGDVLFLAGLLGYLVATYGKALFSHIDGLDGQRDGKIGAPR